MENLPSEIRHCIMQHLDKTDLSNCALVCKAWLPSIQTLLYADIAISHFEQLEQFFRTVEHGPHLGSKVKCLKLHNYQCLNGEVPIELRLKSILTALLCTCLPNLETIQDDISVICTYLKQALLDSRLQFLKRLDVRFSKMKKNDLSEYIFCVLLMKDRLENLYLSISSVDYPANAERQIFNHLYTKLDQFTCLKTIEIRGETNEGISILEYIVESCPTLEEVVWHVRPGSSSPNNNKNSMDSIANFAPRTNIKSFISGDENETLDSKTLTYLMQKFPGLVKCSADLRGAKNIIEQVEQFMRFLSKMKHFNIKGLVMHHDLINKTMSDFWKNTLAYGKGQVIFCYSDFVSSGKDTLRIDQDSALIEYPFSSTSNHREWKHYKFVEQNGELLRRVDYAIHNRYRESTNDVLPDDIVAHTFAYCPYLQELHFEECTLKHLSNLPNEKHWLNELSFWSCYMYPGVQRSLSAVLLEVKNLKVHDIGFINMPDTKIDMITFMVRRGSSAFVKVTHTRNGNDCYYLLPVDKTHALPSTEEEFMNASLFDKFEVCCDTNSMVQKEIINTING